MSKYRIIETTSGLFMPQEKVLWWWWNDLSRRAFNDLETAESTVEAMRQLHDQFNSKKKRTIRSYDE